MKTAYLPKEIGAIELEISLLEMSSRSDDRVKVVQLKKELEKLKKELDKRS